MKKTLVIVIFAVVASLALAAVVFALDPSNPGSQPPPPPGGTIIPNDQGSGPPPSETGVMPGQQYAVDPNQGTSSPTGCSAACSVYWYDASGTPHMGVYIPDSGGNLNNSPQDAPPIDGFYYVPPGRSSPSAPTAVPFNPAVCKCDGIQFTDLFSGQPATITSFSKVEGADVGKAEIVDQTFTLYEGAESIVKRILASDPIPASIVSEAESQVRYKSIWQFTMPQLKNGATYRLQSVINCQPKLQTFNYGKANTAVLAQGTGPDSTPSPTGKRSLQLGAVYPVEIFQKTCSFIKFRYEGPSTF